jgi:type II secretory pathway component PulF
VSKSDSSQSSGPVTLDQFIAFNDELAALIRAGVPLERGLADAARDLGGKLGAMTKALGQRMGEGVGLAQAIEASGGRMPDLYRAIIEAGIRSGRLAQALEGMAAVAKGYAEARRAVGIALLYPLIVAVLAYTLSLGLVTRIVPRFLAAFQDLGVPTTTALEILGRLDDTAIYWGPVPPILLLLLWLRWAWSGRSAALDASGIGPFWLAIPLAGGMVASYRASSFAGLLALLTEHRVPLDEAVRLAGEASPDRRFREAATEVAESIRRGEVGLEAKPGDPGPFPPLLRWMITAGDRQGDLPRALKQLAETYRVRARSRADVLKLALPTVCMLGIGVGAVLIYALMLFLPLVGLYEEMALPVNR